MASNSLLEALVFAHRSYIHASAKWKEIESPHNPFWNTSFKPISYQDEEFISSARHEFRHVMSTNVGILRCDEQLDYALDWITTFTPEMDKIYNAGKISASLVELRNMLVIASLIVKQSIERTENKGVFFKGKSVEVNSFRDPRL